MRGLSGERTREKKRLGSLMMNRKKVESCLVRVAIRTKMSSSLVACMLVFVLLSFLVKINMKKEKEDCKELRCNSLACNDETTVFLTRENKNVAIRHFSANSWPIKTRKDTATMEMTLLSVIQCYLRHSFAPRPSIKTISISQIEQSLSR